MTTKLKNHKRPATSVSISLPEIYLSYLELAKETKGWTVSEAVRRGLDLLMKEEPLAVKE